VRYLSFGGRGLGFCEWEIDSAIYTSQEGKTNDVGLR
jgi:hypothetical protein